MHHINPSQTIDNGNERDTALQISEERQGSERRKTPRTNVAREVKASIGVRWIDGPISDQVEPVIGVFEGSYFDGSIDYKGRIHHMIDGQEVSFGADWIRSSRDYSNAPVQRAIDRVMRRYVVEFPQC